MLLECDYNLVYYYKLIRFRFGLCQKCSWLVHKNELMEVVRNKEEIHAHLFLDKIAVNYH